MSSLSAIIGIVTGRIRRSGAFARSGMVVAGGSDPVPVRSRFRGLRRLLETTPHPRSGLGSAFAVAFIATGWMYGALVSGSSQTLLSGAASSVGLKTTDIVITGQVETSEQDVFGALDLGKRPSLLGFDAAAARSRILALPWVKDVAIRKLYPGKLTVALAEKRAVAVWQHEDRLTVVEKSGAPIAKFGIADLINNRFAHLPHLVGKGAPETARDILPLVGDHPILAGQVASYVRVADRRWDLELENGIRIKLPEQGAGKRLAYLSNLASEDRILERELDVIDMRLADRTILQLQPVAAKTRSELVSARLKAMKKADRKL